MRLGNCSVDLPKKMSMELERGEEPNLQPPLEVRKILLSMIVLGRSAFWLQDEVVGVAEPFRPSDRRTDGARRDTGPRARAGARAPCRAVAGGKDARWPGVRVAAPHWCAPCENPRRPPPLRNGGVRGTQIPRDRLRLCYSFRVAPPEGGALAPSAPFDGYAPGTQPHAAAPAGRLVCMGWRVGECAAGVHHGHGARMLAGLHRPVNSYPSSSHRRLSTDDYLSCRKKTRHMYA